VKTIELFAGTKSFSKIAQEFGYKTFTVDFEEKLNPDFCSDILEIQDLPECDFLWCSPPCTTFSVASMMKHWTGGFRKYIPATEECKKGLEILDHTIMLISKNKSRYWFIENPRGVMRKIIDDLFKKHGITDYVRNTVTYCQYGDNRMKPTDIWTNMRTWSPRPCCHNGDKCHESAPRGARTGTQGMKGAMERGVIPPDVFREIFSSER
jgi:hypothetical protein